jgi:hypothetical protein
MAIRNCFFASVSLTLAEDKQSGADTPRLCPWRDAAFNESDTMASCKTRSHMLFWTATLDDEECGLRCWPLGRLVSRG